MKDNDLPEVAYLWKHNGIWLWGVEDELKYASHKYILADTSISKQMAVTLINQARKEEQDKTAKACVKSYNNALEDADKRHKAQLQELEKRLINDASAISNKSKNRYMQDRFLNIIQEAFKEVV